MLGRQADRRQALVSEVRIVGRLPVKAGMVLFVADYGENNANRQLIAKPAAARGLPQYIRTAGLST